MRNVMAAIAGGLFGAGLWLSGMTDTTKVQGWLDFFGAWDPTLAFVMGGAIIPMALAWAWTRGRRPVLGGRFPEKPPARVGPSLVTGAVLFGAGWGLVGLCPGPVIAALSFGGWPVWLFLLSMLGGMVLAPAAKAQLDRFAAPQYGK